ncbi:16S rRNA processing protein RimM, partial [bacterium]|nr:16S rRNA processing protein RimM [bacterium]
MEKRDNELVLLGRLCRPWGLRGELLFQPEHDGTLPFHTNFTEVHLEGVEKPVAVDGWRVDGSGRLYLRLHGIETREEAKPFSDRLVYVHRDELPETGEGVYYVYQLVDLTVLYEDGVEVGRILRVEPGAGGANDVLVVKTPRGEERLFPFARAAVVSIDPEAGRVVLRRMGEE